MAAPAYKTPVRAIYHETDLEAFHKSKVSVMRMEAAKREEDRMEEGNVEEGACLSVCLSVRRMWV